MAQRSPAEKVFLKRTQTIYSGMKRRAKEMYDSVPFTLDQFREWVTAQFSGNIAGIARCEYSGQKTLTAETFCIDHKMPTSRGGGFWFTNLAICSEKENLRKGDLAWYEYDELKKTVNEFSPKARDGIWRRLEVGDVQRFSHYRRQRKGKTK